MEPGHASNRGYVAREQTGKGQGNVYGGDDMTVYVLLKEEYYEGNTSVIGVYATRELAESSEKTQSKYRISIDSYEIVEVELI